MTQATSHILIVEDDIELAQWMEDYLIGKAYQVSVVHNGNDAVAFINEQNPDLVILDGMLPGLDGIDVCKAVRPQFANAIIMVTARDEEIDEVLGLEMGADEYLTKPVRARALLTRIKKHIDRQTANSSEQTDNTTTRETALQTITFNQLSIDPQTRVASISGEDVNVSSHEFDVLWLLAKQAGEIVSRNDLVSQLRGFDYDGFDRSIDLKVSRLRKKLGDNSSKPTKIKTIWGKGYLFVKDAW